MRTKLPLLLLLLMILSTSATAQVKFRVKKLNTDSLAALIPSKKGTDKIDALNLLSNAISRKDLDSAMHVAAMAIDLSERQEYLKGLADGHFNLGNVHFLRDSLEPTITNYLKAYRIYEDLEPSEEFGNLCMQLFLINYFSLRMEAALQYSLHAIRIYEKTGDRPGQAMAWWVSAIQGYIDTWDTAFYFTDRALTFLDPGRHRNEIAYIYNSVGEMYQARFNTTKDTACFRMALSWFFKALRVERIDKDVTAMVLTGIGRQYLDFNARDSVLKGMEYLRQAVLETDSSFDAYDWKPTVYMLLGRSACSLGDYESAIDYFREGIRIIRERAGALSINAYREPDLGINFKRHHKQLNPALHENLSKAYAQLGDYRQALEHFMLSKEAEEETYMEKYADLLTLMEVTSKDEKNQDRIGLLARDNELKALAIKQSRTLNLGIAGIFVVLVLVGLLFLRQNKMRTGHRAVLLEQKLLRLQMNPHFIFNALSNILNLINRKDIIRAASFLSGFSQLLRSTLESSREDYILLGDEITSLKNYLDLQLLRYEDKFDYTVEVDERIDRENAIIPPMLLQPFVENAIEHGIVNKHGKGHVFVRFRLEHNNMVCEVEDNGVGRAKAWETGYREQKTHKSLATEIITDRIWVLNKKLRQRIRLTITDLAGDHGTPAGTRVVLALPYLTD